MKRNIKAFYKLLVPIVLGTVVLFPIGLWIFNITQHLFDHWMIFAILMAGLMSAAGYFPFLLVFNQMGKAATQSLFLLMQFFTNIILNYFLILQMGIYGAALATAITNFSMIFYMKWLLAKRS
ncbi:MAG: polysaccharide biosynthesis C-terminal domain-containing protein [Bacteroidetes bacterium]|nr:polysaccharide biosynthesis C-terminal domain-containing protein [Bacteroidota bacterium]